MSFDDSTRREFDDEGMPMVTFGTGEPQAYYPAEEFGLFCEALENELRWSDGDVNAAMRRLLAKHPEWRGRR